MRLLEHAEPYAVSRLAPEADVPVWVPVEGFAAIIRTLDSLTIICRGAVVPADVGQEGGWTLFELDGQWVFDAVGILHALLEPLALAGVSVLTVASFETDFILVRDPDRARSTWASAGYAVESASALRSNS